MTESGIKCCLDCRVDKNSLPSENGTLYQPKEKRGRRMGWRRAGKGRMNGVRRGGMVDKRKEADTGKGGLGKTMGRHLIWAMRDFKSEESVKKKTGWENKRREKRKWLAFHAELYHLSQNWPTVSASTGKTGREGMNEQLRKVKEIKSRSKSAPRQPTARPVF